MSNIEEIEKIEVDDIHHDFGGPHGNKGHAFAHFWLIVSLLEREKSGASDYMFICEYVQDIAEFESSSAPLKVVLYQLKKKESGYWTAADLTGQLKTSKTKEPKAGKPVVKLYKSVAAFKDLHATGAFITNAKFDVSLASKQGSTNNISISVEDWDDDHRLALRQGLASLYGINQQEIDLGRIELRSIALDVNDLQQHTTGIAFHFLKQVAPDHVSQASSLVDALYVKISAASRSTSKCATWTELVERRGFGKIAFKQAIESLKTIPNREAEYTKLLDRLSVDWSTSERIRVKGELVRIAREKLLVGVGNRWQIDLQPLRDICAAAANIDQPDVDCFDMVCIQLATQLPAISVYEKKALAIYEMVESWI